MSEPKVTAVDEDDGEAETVSTPPPPARLSTLTPQAAEALAAAKAYAAQSLAPGTRRAYAADWPEAGQPGPRTRRSIPSPAPGRRRPRPGRPAAARRRLGGTSPSSRGPVRSVGCRRGRFHPRIGAPRPGIFQDQTLRAVLRQPLPAAGGCGGPVLHSAPRAKKKVRNTARHPSAGLHCSLRQRARPLRSDAPANLQRRELDGPAGTPCSPTVSRHSASTSAHQFRSNQRLAVTRPVVARAL